jgi:hypothetical protein
MNYPKFKQLPISSAPSGTPKGAAWGVFDKDGKKDVRGTLNFITRDVVKKAKDEIQTGQSVVLK